MLWFHNTLWKYKHKRCYRLLEIRLSPFSHSPRWLGGFFLIIQNEFLRFLFDCSTVLFLLLLLTVLELFQFLQVGVTHCGFISIPACTLHYHPPTRAASSRPRFSGWSSPFLKCTNDLSVTVSASSDTFAAPNTFVLSRRCTSADRVSTADLKLKRCYFTVWHHAYSKNNEQPSIFSELESVWKQNVM